MALGEWVYHIWLCTYHSAATLAVHQVRIRKVHARTATLRLPEQLNQENPQ